jgi:hypothetical protein
MVQFARLGAAIRLAALLASVAGCSGSTTHGGGGGGGGGGDNGCEYAGKRYAVGDSVPSGNGCNQCACTEAGEVSCTLKYCEPADGCTYGGKSYAVGSSFEDPVGCNHCTCQANGEVACKKVACGDSCKQLTAALEIELANVQACMTAADCGQPIAGSSCGCTRDLVARNDADVTRYVALQKNVSKTCGIGGGTCDCPTADGFACENQRCAWNYVKETTEPECVPYEAGRLCVRGTPTGDGEVMAVGDTLSVTVSASGCFSSSCSKVHTAECSIGDNAGFEVAAAFCVANTAEPDKACTDDCGDVHADCSVDQPLSAGEHQVKVGSLVVGFQVPTKLPNGGLCAGEP